MAHARGMSKRFGAVALGAAAASVAACLDGCAAAPPPAVPPPAVPPALSYDFSPLLPAPFGTSFKDIPVPLTEVLVFNERAQSRANEYQDCFRPNGSIEFLGRPPTDYLVCFEHDRLSRIEASVELPEPLAPAVFAAACAEWQGGVRTQGSASDACDGRRGDIEWSARRTPGSDPAAATISIALSGTTGP